MKISLEIIEQAKQRGACKAGIEAACHPDATWETLDFGYVAWAARYLILPEAERELAYKICGIIRFYDEDGNPYIPAGYLYWPNESRFRGRICLTPVESEPMIPA